MKKICLFLLLLGSFVSCNKSGYWPEPTSESHPWTRWWWMGNAVDEANLTRELKEMKKAGIGGVEITPIYGVKGEEKRFIDYLSPRFSEVLRYTLAEADKLGMGVDLPPGSGWRCGGPFVPEEKGLWNLEIEKASMKKGVEWHTGPGKSRVISIMCINSGGKRESIDPAVAAWKAPEDVTLYVARLRKSGDKVKRAAQGGTGWSIDTFNKEITGWYLDEFWQRLNVPEEKIRCFFHDSFEYTGDITTTFTDEFKKRRGYDMAQYLDVLNDDCSDENLVARVKSDYRETLADLVLESFIQPMTEWANKHKSLNRNQAHGSPGNILDLYAACNIPETEIFRSVPAGSTDIFVNKFASSAAHVTGQKLVSSESFTWLNEHWNVTTSQMMRATNRFFLAGINHMFFHGTCYSPTDAEWPGWLFYASTQVNNRNPLWRELPALFSYITRSQAVMQSSRPVSDFLVYWPYYDVIADKGKLFNHIGVSSRLPLLPDWFAGHSVSRLSRTLFDKGYTFDYISDRQLQDCSVSGTGIATSGKSVYKAVVVPETDYMPLPTLEKLKALIAAGTKVYFSNHLPSDVPGLGNLAERRAGYFNVRSMIDSVNVCGEITELLARDGIRGEASLSSNGLYFNKFEREDETWYHIFNCTDEMKDASVTLSRQTQNYLILDPMTLKTGLAEMDGNSLRLQLAPERAVFIRCTDAELTPDHYGYLDITGSPELIEGKWNVVFVAGGPELPASFDTDTLGSWTKQLGPEYEHFAGTARYTVDFDYDGEGRKATLNLGTVYDCARVKFNGKDMGTLPGPDFLVNVGNLKKGRNRLEVEVTNVAANRIRDLDQRGVQWRKFHDINLVNIEYLPFDASGWNVKPAGLIGPVVLTSMNE